MLNRISKFSFLFVVAIALAFVSCEKEGLEELVTSDNLLVSTADSRDGGDGEAGERGQRGNRDNRDGKGNKGGKGNKCFQTIFPATLAFPDGTSQEVADKAAAKEAKKVWKEANPDAEERPSIAFPYDVMLKDSTTMTLTSQEEVDALKETCGGDKGGKKGKRGKGNACFQVTYPVSITIDGGEAVAINEKSDKKAALQAWKEANPDATEKPDVALVFPITVTLEDGTESTLGSQEELDTLKESCPQKGGKGDKGGKGGKGGRG